MGSGTHNRFFYHTSGQQTSDSEESESGNSSTLTIYKSWYEELTFQEQICWAFKVLPSEMNELYWRYSFSDFRFKLKISVSEKMAEFSQHFENLSIVVSRALGGGSKEDNKNTIKPTENWNEALAACSNIFG